jgi:hypothetical protein
MTTNTLPPTESQIASMRQAILTAVPQREHKVRRMRLILGGAIAVAIVGSVTAGALVYRANVEALNGSFDCYTTANINDPHGTSRYPDGVVSTDRVDSLTDRVAFALQTCEAGYRAVPTSHDPAAGPYDVPNPTACVLNDSRIAVLANKGGLSNAAFCSSVGLAPAE